MFAWVRCNWAGHFWLPWKSIFGQSRCVMCGLLRDEIGPVTQYVRMH